ncbi:RsmE family RNA methyltransferase [Ezakiella peruensis]|uniref:RsmE family RNA methyltransferase n=1 Tax=Ezakiella peruensis TaxID=1464038 RepID=UPI000C1AFF46|nr:RsmE family RNA methyltransferase [Ezakiella peruensis]
MDRVFLDDFVLTDGDYKHMIKARRLGLGDRIEAVINGELYLCEIVEVSKNSAEIQSIEKLEIKNLGPKITLYQSVIDKKKMESVFKYCTALGVSKFVPVVTRFTDAIKDKNFVNERNYGILKEAAQQSKGCFLPEISKTVDFKEAVLKAKKDDLSLILYELEDSNFIGNLDFINIDSISIFVGPEGGYHKDEVDFAIQNGVEPVRLFSRILRSELAGFSALSIINSCVEAYESKD